MRGYVQKWRQDDTPLFGLHFWEVPEEPKKINELVHKIEQISLCTSQKERQQHKLLSPHTERQELSLLANQRI